MLSLNASFKLLWVQSAELIEHSFSQSDHVTVTGHPLSYGQIKKLLNFWHQVWQRWNKREETNLKLNFDIW